MSSSCELLGVEAGCDLLDRAQNRIKELEAALRAIADHELACRGVDEEGEDACDQMQMIAVSALVALKGGDR